MTLIIQTEELAQRLNSPADKEKLILIDVRPEERYLAGHLPGARRLEYGSIVRQSLPVGGLLPATADFNLVLQNLGANADSSLVVYDDEGGAAASRLIWTLHSFGHYGAQLLDGGIVAWAGDGRSLEQTVPVFNPGNIELSYTGGSAIDTDTLLQQMRHDPPALLDARSIEEFTGTSVRANHGGRIPGAFHLEWTAAMDRQNGLRLLPDEQLHAMLQAAGASPEKPIVVYCQTHHRSSLSYTMLLHLGYQHVTALEGAWSAWGNRDDTPKESG